MCSRDGYDTKVLILLKYRWNTGAYTYTTFKCFLCLPPRTARQTAYPTFILDMHAKTLLHSDINNFFVYSPLFIYICCSILCRLTFHRVSPIPNTHPHRAHVTLEEFRWNVLKEIECPLADGRKNGTATRRDIQIYGWTEMSFFINLFTTWWHVEALHNNC